MPAFEYRHVVGFEETNLIGNVYYVNHVRWQGRCRELFLHEKAPSVLRELERGLVLATTRCSCDYRDELRALDTVVIRMRLQELVQNRIRLSFEYWRQGESGGNDVLVATGEQEIACMQRQESGTTPVAIPEALRSALAPYHNDA
jgi:enediyne biosynthesis thioesterase